MALIQASNAAWATTGLPGVVDTVQLLAPWNSVLVYNRSTTQELYFRADGVDPTPSGDNSKIVRSGEVVIVSMAIPNTPEVRVVSSGSSVAYGVEEYT